MTCPHGYQSAASCMDCLEDVGLGAAPIPPERTVRRYTAQFSGQCGECLHDIAPGDAIVLTTLERYLHTRCHREPPT